jgi:AraC-like DNA-binding protein
MTELQSQSLMYSVVRSGFGIANSANVERHNVHSLPRETETLETGEMHAEMLRCARGEAVDMQFMLSSHLIMFFPDGMSGGCEWSNGDRIVKLSCVVPNTIIFNPAQSHLSLRKRTSQTSIRILLLMITPASIRRLLCDETPTITFEQRIGVDDADMRRTLLIFLQEIESPGWNSERYVDTLLTLLLSQLVRCISNLGKPRPVVYKKGGLPGWRLKRALELLDNNLREAPSLVELARQMQVHPTSLCRTFKQSMGVTPHRYLLLQRVKCAKEMMNDHNRTLTDIAGDCGFNSSSQFSLVFRRIAGMSPRQYRQSL